MTLVYVDDVAAGHLAAFDRGRPGERYILADGYASMRELVAAAVEAGGAVACRRGCRSRCARRSRAAGEGVSRVIRRPPLIGKGALTFLLWEARADSSKAREELGVEFTPWREGGPTDRRVDRAARGGGLVRAARFRIYGQITAHRGPESARRFCIACKLTFRRARTSH